jgi:hypothetical protein
MEVIYMATQLVRIMFYDEKQKQFMVEEMEDPNEKNTQEESNQQSKSPSFKEAFRLPFQAS